ncbi:hypothetical protein [Photobacterium carnosum]|uniref:hypothetical protein n=1 Tax=Photobacterium carnosum TaxID=2023717 RepID=UPI001E3DBEC2|nr:hypothetical protein [Photobacterium carnosum]MCD9539238.1 hypothetical protein [Photobacterium carnosum]MCF2163774.1 hypothetical protein [Photobacterium carnosum]
MSLEQQIGALVKASENLTGAVNGKIGEIDKEVDAAKAQFQQFQNEADERYQSLINTKFRVGGEWGKFYPVFIRMAGGPVNNLNLYRPSTYENVGNITGFDGSSTGTFTASIFGIADNWGHRIPFYSFDSYHYKDTMFLGEVLNNSRIDGLWVWLRGGGLDYYLTHDRLPMSSEDIKYYSAESGSLGNFKVIVFLGGYKNGEYGADYQSILISNIDQSLPSNGYIRGIV